MSSGPGKATAFLDLVYIRFPLCFNLHYRCSDALYSQMMVFPSPSSDVTMCFQCSDVWRAWLSALSFLYRDNLKFSESFNGIMYCRQWNVLWSYHTWKCRICLTQFSVIWHKMHSLGLVSDCNLWSAPKTLVQHAYTITYVGSMSRYLTLK